MRYSDTEVIAHEMKIDGVFARIVRSSDGGPIRRIINGRQKKRTGTFISFKAGLRAMPWDSYNGELPVMKLAEASTGVAGLLAQPHRLEIITAQLKSPLIYFPDLELQVDDAFLSGLVSGTSFATLAARMRTRAEPLNRCRTAIVEVKTPNDPRLDDEEYKEKLGLAHEVYRRLGIPFRIIELTTDFPSTRIAPFSDLFSFDRHTRVDDGDYDTLRRVIDTDSSARPYGEVVKALGGGSVGKSKILAFQLRRQLSIDLSRRITDDSNVLRVR